MSQPCLPIGSRSGSKKRRRGGNRPREEIPPEATTEEEVGFEDIDTMDATEYLSRVVKQAKKMPNLFLSANNGDNQNRPSKRQREHVPIDGSAASLSYMVSPRGSLTAAPTNDYLPKNDAWIETTLSNFEKLRNYLNECRSRGVGGKQTDRKALPGMKDRSGWHLFCVGKDDAQGNAGSYFGDDEIDSKKSIEEKDDDMEEWQKNIPEHGHKPSVRLILQMDQVLIRRVLSHLAHFYCAGWSLTQQRSTWLYALLARLEKPVHREDASTLFGLLKALTAARSKFNVENRDELAKLNSLIVVIGMYFEQGGTAVMKHATNNLK